MIRTLTTAATGLDAQQANIERLSADMANVNTDGYKKSRSEFQDLMYETKKEPGAQIGASAQSPVGIQSGLGVRVGAQHKIFEQGTSRHTGHPWDLSIEGKGFFPVQLPNGELAYSRVGNFHLDAQARLVLSNGALLQPPIQIPAEAINTMIKPNGEVRAQFANGQETPIGQIQLVNFQNEEGLVAVGTSTYRPTNVSGQAIQGVPGENGMGNLMQGSLESSNVNVSNAMVEMMATQRAYEMGTKVMGVADQMWQSTINIK